MIEENFKNIHQELKSQNSEKMIEVMNDKIKFMYDNKV
jgi:hypothetical protein